MNSDTGERTLRFTGTSTLSSAQDSPPLLHDIPAAQLIRYDEFAEGDYIISRQKVGVFSTANYQVTLLLANGTVVIPKTCNCKVRTEPRSTASLPGTKGTRECGVRGDILLSSEAHAIKSQLRPGKFVLCGPESVSEGQWATGAYSSSEIPGDHIIDIRPVDAMIYWLSPNIFCSWDAIR